MIVVLSFAGCCDGIAMLPEILELTDHCPSERMRLRASVPFWMLTPLRFGGPNQIGVESVVQGGSYILRCAEMSVATSFIALLDSDGQYSAFTDPGPGIQPSPKALIARGPLRQIETAMTQAACGGTLIRLSRDKKG